MAPACSSRSSAALPHDRAVFLVGSISRIITGRQSAEGQRTMMLLSRAAVGPGRSEKVEGERVDIASLHDRYLQAVFTYVCCHVPDRSEAEDITAEVFAAALAALPKYRGDSGHYAWLLGIARRKIVDATRRRYRRELLDTDLTEQERESLGLLLATDIAELPEEAIQHEEARQE